MLDIIKSLLGIGTADVRSLPPHEALALADKPDVALVDVREADEIRRTGKVEGALHIPAATSSAAPIRAVRPRIQPSARQDRSSSTAPRETARRSPPAR